MSGKQIHFEEYTIVGKKYRLHLFDKIETREQAYMLGYMIGDGGYNRPTHKRNARMFASTVDKYIIDHFKQHFQPDNAIDSRIPINRSRPEIIGRQIAYRMTFSSKFTPIFKRHGILSLKKNRTFHNIPKNKMSQFILGLVDADGYITWGKRKDRNRLWCNFGVTHPSLKMLEKLQRFLLEELKIPTSISPKGTEKCYILRTGSLPMIARFIEFIYKDTPSVYNKRKYNNSMQFLSEFKSYEYDIEKSKRQIGK